MKQIFKLIFFVWAMATLPIIVKAQNVGIGTITPTEKLEINGNVRADTLKHIIDPSASAADHFGTAVSIDGSTKRFIIGVPNFAFARGKAVFGRVN